MDAHKLCIRITGKVEREGDTFVYQRTARGYGNLEQPGRWDMQLRRHVIPTDYQTAPQLACRARLRNATLAWQQLGENDKQHWRNLASQRRLTGFNLFVRDYCRTHPL